MKCCDYLSVNASPKHTFEWMMRLILTTSAARLRKIAGAINFVLLTACFPWLAWAQIPELSPGTTLNGTESSAHFFAGLSQDGGITFVQSPIVIDPSSPFDLVAEVHIANEHVNENGCLYLVALLGEQAWMQNAAAQFLPWDRDLLSLISATPDDKVLSSVETLNPITQFTAASVGLQGVEVSFYFAYESSKSPGDLIYSSRPLQVTFGNYSPSLPIYEVDAVVDTEVFDPARERAIPVLLYLTSRPEFAPTLLFSHGLGGDRYNVTYLAEHWARRGFNVLNLQHPGSDSGIFAGIPVSEYLTAMLSAATLSNSIARVEDVHSVLNQLELWNGDSTHVLYQRIDLSRIGMSGHSFGARTTQNVSGQRSTLIPGETRDQRISAAVVFSPSLPSTGSSAAAFAEVNIPWLLMTGTKDESVASDVTPEERRMVFPLLPEGGKYELVLFEGEHHAFTSHEVSSLQAPRNPAHHGEIQAITTAFWEAWLMEDVIALDWLEGQGAEGVLEEGDEWQFK